MWLETGGLKRISFRSCQWVQIGYLFLLLRGHLKDAWPLLFSRLCTPDSAILNCSRFFTRDAAIPGAAACQAPLCSSSSPGVCSNSHPWSRGCQGNPTKRRVPMAPLQDMNTIPNTKTNHKPHGFPPGLLGRHHQPPSPHLLRKKRASQPSNLTFL